MGARSLGGDLRCDGNKDERELLLRCTSVPHVTDKTRIQIYTFNRRQSRLGLSEIEREREEVRGTILTIEKYYPIRKTSS